MKVWTPFSGHARLNTALLGIAALVLAVFVGISYRQWGHYRAANAAAERSRETLAAINSVLAAMEEADRGERGFLLTGENRFLEPYNQALQELPNDLASLRQLLSASQRSTADIDQLSALTGRKLEELRETLEVRRSKGLTPAIPLVLGERDSRTMHSIRDLCDKMRRDESARQTQASAEGEAAAGVALLMTVAGSVVLLFLFAFGLEPFASPDPQAWQRPWVLRYGAAILAVVAITLIRAALSPLMGPMAMPFTMYFCAVMFAAWFGGFRPALLSTVLSLVAGAWFFAAPTKTLLVSGHDDQVAMLMLVLVGFGTGLLSRSQRRAVEWATQAEAELRRERERLSLALTAGKMGVYEMDLVRNTLWLSPESHALLGTAPEKAGPSLESFLGLIHAQDRALLLEHIQRGIEAHGPIHQEFRIVRPDGKECWISCRGEIDYGEGGRAVRHSGLLIDVSVRKESEQMLRKWEKLATAARLSAAMAHEINNPLSAVTNLIYLAKEGDGVPGPILEKLIQAEQELERVAHASRQALGFYRESSNAESIDIPELIESTVKIFRPRIAEKKIKMVLGYQKCAPAFGVRGEIRQVVSNLLANAIEAVSEGGTISVGARQVETGEERAIEIIVGDDGHGIAQEHLDHIFEPFFTTKTETGTGLGLWVAKEIMERHRGSIAVEAQSGESGGRGATFTLRLPNEAGIAAARGKAPQRAGARDGGEAMTENVGS